MEDCDYCGGTGIEWSSKWAYGELTPISCGICNGDGKVKTNA